MWPTFLTKPPRVTALSSENTTAPRIVHLNPQTHQKTIHSNTPMPTIPDEKHHNLKKINNQKTGQFTVSWVTWFRRKNIVMRGAASKLWRSPNFYHSNKSNIPCLHFTPASELPPIHITQEWSSVLDGKTKLHDTTATKTLLQMTINHCTHQNTLYHIIMTHIASQSYAHILDKFQYQHQNLNVKIPHKAVTSGALHPVMGEMITK